MTNFTRVDATVACGGAAEVSALDALKKDGFKSVINLRMASEPGANIEQNQAKAKELGLVYIHIPFSAGSPDPKVIDQFLAAIADKANQPVFIHCASAQRVGTVWLAKRVLQDDYSSRRPPRRRTPSASATPASRSSRCSTSPTTRSRTDPGSNDEGLRWRRWSSRRRWLLPAAARADILLTPYAGDEFLKAAAPRLSSTSRASSAARSRSSGPRTSGVEVDSASSPTSSRPRDLDIDVLGTNNVTTVMGNLVFGRFGGGLQPYARGGAGLVRTQVADFGELFDAAESNLGVNVGGGLLAGRRPVLAARRRPLLPQPDRHRRAAARRDARRLRLLARHGGAHDPVLAAGG